MARQSDDDRILPECFMDETRIGRLRPDEPGVGKIAALYHAESDGPVKVVPIEATAPH